MAANPRDPEVVVAQVYHPPLMAVQVEEYRAPPPAQGLRRMLAVFALGVLVGGALTARNYQDISNWDLRSRGGDDIYRNLLSNGNTGMAAVFANAVRNFNGPTHHADVPQYCAQYVSRCYNSLLFDIPAIQRRLEEDIILSGGAKEQPLLNGVRELVLAGPVTPPEIMGLEDATRKTKRASIQLYDSIRLFQFAVAKHYRAAPCWDRLLKALSDWTNARRNEIYSQSAEDRSIEFRNRAKQYERERDEEVRILLLDGMIA